MILLSKIVSELQFYFKIEILLIRDSLGFRVYSSGTVQGFTCCGFIAYKLSLCGLKCLYSWGSERLKPRESCLIADL